MYLAKKTVLLGMVLLGISGATSTVPGTIQETGMIKNSIFDHRITNIDILHQFDSVSSATECGEKCSSDIACLSYFYNAFKKSCQTHCSIFFQRDASFQFSRGYIYYQVIREDCQALTSNDFNDASCLRYDPKMFSKGDGCQGFTLSDEGDILPVTSVVKSSTTTSVERLTSTKASPLMSVTSAVKQKTTTTRKPTSSAVPPTTFPTTTLRVISTPTSVSSTESPPQSCQWFGTPPFCNPWCRPGWMASKYSKSGNGASCWTGNKVLCCTEGESCRLIGKQPFCGSSRKTCYSNVLEFSRLESAWCLTGSLALCCNFKRRQGCNGLAGLCDLTFDKVTFAGSHNAGSGSDGTLEYSFGLPAISCFYRNQYLSFADQLTSGIRFFDIDVCWKSNRVYNCHKNAYGAPLTKSLVEISVWMSNEDNLNEVVAMRVHDYNNLPSAKGVEVMREITEAFSGKDGRPGLSYFRPTNYKWPTLREAIQKNQRVFVFLHSFICGYDCQRENKWVHSETYYTDTWTSFSLMASCAPVVGFTRQKCETSRELVQMSNIASYGLCIDDLAKRCNRYLKTSALECIKERKKVGKTVNFLLADFIEEYGGGDNPRIAEVADQINKINIEMFGT